MLVEVFGFLKTQSYQVSWSLHFQKRNILEEKLRNIRGTKDTERRQEMIKKEIMKLTTRGQNTKQDKVIQDAVNRNEWKLRERVREFEDFEDEELLQIALDKDEVSRRKS